MPEETINLKEPQTTVSGERANNLKVLLLLALVSFTGIFLYSTFFGAYEDDYPETLPFFQGNTTHFLYTLTSLLKNAPEGRPVSWALNAVLDHLLGHSLSLEYSYLAGWLIFTLNAYLIFALLKKVLNQNAAIVGALFLLLVPFDLSKPILMHRAFVYLSMTFLLVGLNLSNSRSKWLQWLAYPAAFLSLVTWEAFYLPFLFAPLLWFEKSKRWVIRAGLHVAIWIAMVGLTLLVRYLSGEDRVVALTGGGQGMLSNMLMAVLIGPASAASATVTRPFEALFYAEPTSLLLGMFVAAAVFHFLAGSKQSQRVGPHLGDLKFLAAMVAGIAAVLFPYLLMYRPGYFPPNTTIGRLSAVHAPAEPGFCILVSGVYFLLERQLNRFRILLVSLFAGFFGCLMAFSLHIQKTEYVEGWLAERQIWTRIGELIPDIREGMHVVVDLKNLPSSQMFQPVWLNGESSISLKQLFVFPKEWHDPVTLSGLAPWCEYEKTADSVKLKEPSWQPDDWPALRSGNFILLRVKNGELERVDEPVDIFGVVLTPKPQEPAPALKLTSLGRRLLVPKDSRDWPLLRGEFQYPK
jgi:hypothetical protein